jgi:hypothetical protein
MLVKPYVFSTLALSFASFGFAKGNHRLNTSALVEMEAGTLVEGSRIAGEKEALEFIKIHEPLLFQRVNSLDIRKFRSKYSKQLVWFQRVGNYRKTQKCEGVAEMQADFGIPVTFIDDCKRKIVEKYLDS